MSSLTSHFLSYLQFLSVFCNAVDKKDRDNNTQKALDVFDTFPKYGLKPDAVTYRGMIKMYILGKDIHSAIELKENMIKQVNGCELQAKHRMHHSCSSMRYSFQ